MCEATSANKPLPTIFGGIVTITLFGSKAVDAFLLPLIIPYFKIWDASLETTHNLGRQMELHYCQQAIMVRYLIYIHIYICLWWLILSFCSQHISCRMYHERMLWPYFCSKSVRENRLHGLSMRGWKISWGRNWWCCRMLRLCMLHVYCRILKRRTRKERLLRVDGDSYTSFF